MITLNLDADEHTILVAILENYLSDLRMEMANTDRQAFREQLKLRRDVLHKVLGRLREAQV